MPEILIDTVRASKDGHQFHEAWVARCSLGLLLSRNGLYAIAVEGLAEGDDEGLSGETVEIADATFYYGEGASFEACSRMEIAQFKYSIAAKDKLLRVADARKTLAKFATAEGDLTAKFDPTAISAKLTYSLNTNRPISVGMMEALRAATTGEVPTSEDARRSSTNCVQPFRSRETNSAVSRRVSFWSAGWKICGVSNAEMRGR
jgi:hypothetical protein